MPFKPTFLFRAMSAFSFGGYAVHWNDDLDSIILIIPFEFFLNSDKSHTFSVAVILSTFLS